VTNYADPTISLADHLAAALKPLNRTDIACVLADAFGERVQSGRRSVLAAALLNGTAVDNVLAEIRDLLDGTTAIGEVAS
jgi:hypothetical protein